MSSSPTSSSPTSSAPTINQRRQLQWRSPQANFRQYLGYLYNTLAAALTFLALIPLMSLLYYVLANGIPQLTWQSLTDLPTPAGVPGGGFGNAIQGTLILVTLGLMLSVPVGMLAGIYLAEFGKQSLPARVMRFFTNVLSGVPSIVMGVFAYSLFVLGQGYSTFAGGFALAVLMVPVITRATEEALKLVPNSIRQGAWGLGAYHYQAVFKVILPSALPGVVTGILLAIARAAGETAPLIFTALFSQFWFDGVGRPVASLAVLIFNYAGLPFPEKQALSWTGAVLLIGLVSLTTALSRLALRHFNRTRLRNL